MQARSAVRESAGAGFASRRVAALLMSSVLLLGCGTEAPETNAVEAGPEGTRIDAILVAEGLIVFAALLAFEETRAVVLDEVDLTDWRSYAPGDLPAVLSATDRHAILAAVERHLTAAGPEARAAFQRRLRRWLLAWRQYQVYVGLYHQEGFLAAAFSMAETRELFATALAQRGLDPDTTAPAEVGATLASAEAAALLHRWLRTVSALEATAQAAYYQGFFARLRVLAPQV